MPVRPDLPDVSRKNPREIANIINNIIEAVLVCIAQLLKSRAAFEKCIGKIVRNAEMLAQRHELGPTIYIP